MGNGTSTRSCESLLKDVAAVSPYILAAMVTSE